MSPWWLLAAFVGGILLAWAIVAGGARLRDRQEAEDLANLERKADDTLWSEAEALIPHERWRDDA